MNRKTTAIFTACIMTVCVTACGNSGESSVSPDSTSQAAIETEELSTEEVKEAVDDAIAYASSARDLITGWNTMNQARRMEPIEDALTTISITVEDGVWTAAFSNTSIYTSMGNYTITADGVGTRAGNHVETTNLTEQLEIDIANRFTDLDNAFFAITMYGGKTGVAYFVNGKTSPIQEIEDNIGDQGDWIDTTFEWSGEIPGTLSDGTIVGTSPYI